MSKISLALAKCLDTNGTESNRVIYLLFIVAGDHHLQMHGTLFYDPWKEKYPLFFDKLSDSIKLYSFHCQKKKIVWLLASKIVWRETFPLQTTPINGLDICFLLKIIELFRSMGTYVACWMNWMTETNLGKDSKEICTQLFAQLQKVSLWD